MGDILSLTGAGREPAPGRRPALEPLWRRVVGAVLRAERTAQRRTLAAVAGSAGISTQYLSEIERGRKEPSSEVLAALCGALGLRLLDLTDRTHSALAEHAAHTAAPGSAARRGQHLARRDDPVCQAVGDGLLGGEHPVAIGVGTELLDTVPRVLGEHLLDLRTDAQYLVGLQGEVGYGALAS